MHPEEQHLPKKRVPPSFFHLDISPVIGHTLVHTVGKTHVQVVTLELIWLIFLNILSFNFVPTQRKSLSFARFRRSYVNCPVVVLTNHCQSHTAFLLMCTVQSDHVCFVAAVCSL